MPTLSKWASWLRKTESSRESCCINEESNPNDKDWPLKVKAIYDNLIADLNLKAEEVPLLAGELVNADQNGACAAMNSIIAELPKTIPNSYVISSQGCTSCPDRLHFNATGYRELGTRFGLKMISLLGYKVADPKQPAMLRK
jgi:lysophospholipase L1-like esterase